MDTPCAFREAEGRFTAKTNQDETECKLRVVPVNEFLKVILQAEINYTTSRGIFILVKNPRNFTRKIHELLCRPLRTRPPT